VTEANQYAYETRLNILYKPLEIVDAKALADACEFKWYNQTLCQVNDSVVRLGVLEGEYHWHKHDADDEFFYPGQGFVVPQRVVHRTRAPHRTVVLMVENKGILPTGDPAE
jgi:hypothetical protein